MVARQQSNAVLSGMKQHDKSSYHGCVAGCIDGPVKPLRGGAAPASEALVRMGEHGGEGQEQSARQQSSAVACSRSRSAMPDS